MPPLPLVSTDIESALGGRFVIGTQITLAGQEAVYRATRHLRPDGSSACDHVLLKLRLHAREDMAAQPWIAAAEGVSHPSLARLIEHGDCSVSGRPMRYVAWEFVQGQALSNYLKNGPLLESEVIAIGRDISAAIAAIWSKRIVHGAIMPSSIMLRDSGGAVLIDLGARYLEQESGALDSKPFGRPGYLSPEQARGDKNLAYASDIFSLGIVMLESLLGRHPTDNQQSALAYGLRASGGTLAANVGLICMLDKMLSARPVFRPIPADLSRNFERLLQRMEEESAIRTVPQQRRRA